LTLDMAAPQSLALQAVMPEADECSASGIFLYVEILPAG
jgi:hypothetical protein